MMAVFQGKRTQKLEKKNPPKTLNDIKTWHDFVSTL